MLVPDTRRNKATGGYTIDQTILIVAIIAILVTLIIITIGWQLINRTSGTKLAAQLRQVEDANGQFFAANRVWPHLSYTTSNNATNNMRALAGTVTYTPNTVATVKNYIPGLRDTGSAVVHNFTNNGAIAMEAVTNPFNELQGTYLVVQFTGVPVFEAREAEMAIDAGRNGTENYAAGRFVATTGANCRVGTTVTGITSTTTGNVNVCYAANNID